MLSMLHTPPQWPPIFSVSRTAHPRPHQRRTPACIGGAPPRARSRRAGRPARVQPPPRPPATAESSSFTSVCSTRFTGVGTPSAAPRRTT